jgi:predicted nucleotidyltransferase
MRMLREKLGGNKDVLEAYVFGSVAMGRPGFWSDIDIVVVMETKAPFVERPREFFNLLDLGIPVDILVYTPGEFTAIRNSSSGFWKNFKDSVKAPETRYFLHRISGAGNRHPLHPERKERGIFLILR